MFVRDFNADTTIFDNDEVVDDAEYLNYVDTGNPTLWILSIAIKAILLMVLMYCSMEMLARTLLVYNINLFWLRLCVIPHALLVLTTYIPECFEIARTSYEVIDGCLDGIDLWTVKRFRLGHHCVYLDKYVLWNISQPRKFLNSLEDYYLELTGEYLP